MKDWHINSDRQELENLFFIWFYRLAIAGLLTLIYYIWS